MTREIKEEELDYGLHKDKKKTLVEIEGDLYELVKTDLTVKELLKRKDFKDIPHVRRLNPIPVRTEEEQGKHSTDVEKLHKLCQTAEPKREHNKREIILSGNVPKEIERLMLEKKKAQKEGDEKRARMIRRQLRSLDYKRYVQE